MKQFIDKRFYAVCYDYSKDIYFASRNEVIKDIFNIMQTLYEDENFLYHKFVIRLATQIEIEKAIKMQTLFI